MRSFGINLDSIDLIKKPDLSVQFLNIVREEIFDFVQLNARTTPEYYDDIFQKIKNAMKGIRANIHAPFYLPPKYLGLNTSDPTMLESNIKALEFSQKCADFLKADVIVVHPGIGDTEEHVEETIRQVKIIGDSRVAIENLPYNCYGVAKHGGRPENIRRIVQETSSKFCFDFAHAICSSIALKRNAYDDFSEYFSLKPSLYHLSDGDFSENVDAHLHLGFGNYDIKRFLKEFTDENAMIVLETDTPESETIDPWIKDAEYLKNLGL